MSNELLGALMGVAIVAPLFVGLIAYGIQAHGPGLGFWSLLSLGGAYLFTVGLYVAVGIAGDDRFNNHVPGNDSYYWYWIGGAVALIATALIIMQVEEN